MKKYSDFSKDKNRLGLTDDEMKNVEWTKYKIIVPTQQDKEELMKAFKHFHDSEFDSDNICCNQLAHEYLEGHSIIVDDQKFNSI